MNKQAVTLIEYGHFRLTEAADGVFAAISIPGTGSVGNAAIIDLGEETLIVDTFTTIGAAEELQEAAIRLTGKAASYVVNTHWHSDHTSGNQVFVPKAQIISTSAAREIMRTFGRQRLQNQLADPDAVYQALDGLQGSIQKETDERLKQEMQWEHASDLQYMDMLPDLVYTLPNVTFEQKLSLHGSKRTAEVLTYGGGHTQSDAFVYLPEEKVAVMGDLVLAKHHPVLLHANPQEWLHILEQVEQLDIETIIPGHGEVCSVRELHEIKGYIREITALVAEAIRSKGGIDGIAVPKAYRDWYFATYFKSNLQKIHSLLSQ
ncbi:MBL fold metallo-hydrolase [Ectobacillus ponti]|uniref:MBL fold metallo-hydrolase n=1 Tax=Ectobacillus ponti TaxID=2961894 RepID=A0AA41X3H5_9BACI|nr:MBL fold metallo-hydrolase [Ectobacillus ponti]MCP8968256.1 MBL fold metallo-hydrolase [Ectobacillus ponti]